MAKKKKKPGVMFYFDFTPAVKKLSTDEQAQLFIAILDYGENKVIPEFQGGLSIVWELIRPQIDRDSSKYEKTCRQRAYASYVKVCNDQKKSYVPFEEWERENYTDDCD